MHQLAVNLRRQGFEPVGVVAAQGDIQRQNILHLVGVHRIWCKYGGGGEAVQEGLLPVRRAGEESAFGPGEVLGQ